MDDNLRKIALKISKCLALASSDNIHEAGQALKQARALMDKFNLSETDIGMLRIVEKCAPTGYKLKVPIYLNSLSFYIADAFGCKAIVYLGSFTDCEIGFFGMGNGPEMCVYCYEVLSRQMKRDRAGYVKKALARYRSQKNKVRMADIFSHAWVGGIIRKLKLLTRDNPHAAVIAAYMHANHPDTKKDERKGPAVSSRRKMTAYASGLDKARQVNLSMPVGVNEVLGLPGAGL